MSPVILHYQTTEVHYNFKPLLITSFLGPDSEVIYTFTILNLDKKPYESRPFTTMKCTIIISFDDPGFTHIVVY